MSISSFSAAKSSSSLYLGMGVRGRTITPVHRTSQYSEHMGNIKIKNLPDRAASSTPNGLIKLKNESTLELLAVNSTIQLFSATSTTRPPNWSARVLIADRCKFFAINASLADMS